VGDQSIVLHWDRNMDTNVTGYRVYRSTNSEGAFQLHSPGLLISAGLSDLQVTNGQTYYYQVTSMARVGPESAPSTNIAATARPFTSEDEFLEYVQQTGFDYFWYEANPTNGMVKDRTTTTSPCSIAAVGFGLSAICVGIDRGWITREQGAERVFNTVRWFWEAPQGTNQSGTIGHRGWFYHFLDMKSGLRYMTFRPEVSTIDTALFLAGAIHCREYFNGPSEREAAIRTLVDSIYERIDWAWMTVRTNVLRMGWHPESGFISSTWNGYNEASILYILGMGAPSNALPASSWASWTNGYKWSTSYGPGFVTFPPLFGHQYSQCWLDLRHTADNYMRTMESTYFENSRRATIAQRAYAFSVRMFIAGTVATFGYYSVRRPTANWLSGPRCAARGKRRWNRHPTAPGGSVPFAPEYCIPALRHIYNTYRTNIWTSYGFRDAFHPGKTGGTPMCSELTRAPS
jgi:hypothetical protein